MFLVLVCLCLFGAQNSACLTKLLYKRKQHVHITYVVVNVVAAAGAEFGQEIAVLALRTHDLPLGFADP